MPLPTFTPVVRASPGAQSAPVVSLHMASFGDGYTHASPVGINHIRQTVELTWEGLVLADMTSLKIFFEERGGYKSFYYQPLGYSAALRWMCKEWGFTQGAPYRFTAKLSQSFTNEL